MIHILAIETSCDDTSAAIISDGEVKSNVVATQLDHQALGGVVPELASRQHMQNIAITVETAISKAKIDKKQLSAIAVTQGPGLLGSLIVGVNFAKAMALALDLPLISVHHMHGHILSHFAQANKPPFPFLCLTISGGHTQIVRVNSFTEMDVLGSTIDDAVGEAFDKIGKMLGLPYPAGPHIDRLASEGEVLYHFTKPKVNGLDFSFSGFKTSVMHFLKAQVEEDTLFVEKNLAHICASVQYNLIQILLEKVMLAVKNTGIRSIAIAGGVAANKGLRSTLMALENEGKISVYIPEFQYCTDNAAMIGIAAHYYFLAQRTTDQSMVAEPRLAF